MLHAPAIAVNFRPATPPVTVAPEVDPVAAVRLILETPDGDLDYAAAKLAVDTIIDPTANRSAILGQLDELTETARKLANGDPRPQAKLAAVRRLLHVSGWWNDHRPFTYDQSDPTGQGSLAVAQWG